MTIVTYIGNADPFNHMGSLSLRDGALVMPLNTYADLTSQEIARTQGLGAIFYPGQAVGARPAPTIEGEIGVHGGLIFIQSTQPVVPVGMIGVWFDTSEPSTGIFKVDDQGNTTTFASGSGGGNLSSLVLRYDSDGQVWQSRGDAPGMRFWIGPAGLTPDEFVDGLDVLIREGESTALAISDIAGLQATLDALAAGQSGGGAITLPPARLHTVTGGMTTAAGAGPYILAGNNDQQTVMLNTTSTGGLRQGTAYQLAPTEHVQSGKTPKLVVRGTVFGAVSGQGVTVIFGLYHLVPGGTDNTRVLGTLVAGSEVSVAHSNNSETTLESSPFDLPAAGVFAIGTRVTGTVSVAFTVQGAFTRIFQ